MSFKNKFFRFLFGPERGILGRIENKYLNGLRLATIGGLLTFIGAGAVAFGAESFGKIAVVAGIFTAVVGISLHFVLMIIRFMKHWN